MTARVDPQTSRFLSQEECQALGQRIVSFATGGGSTSVSIQSVWMGTLQWVRNRISAGNDTRYNSVTIARNIRGASASVSVSQIDDASLTAAVRRAEQLLQLNPERREDETPTDYTQEPYLQPQIWSDTTYNLDIDRRTAAVHALVQPAEKAGMLSGGMIQARAVGTALLDPTGHMLYYPYTLAEFSVTVRNVEGTASGWAGVDFSDWNRIDAPKLCAVALEKCLQSRNPVAVEPGRYTVVLEPQAVCDLFGPLMGNVMERGMAEATPGMGPFSKHDGHSRIGDKVLDERLTISADPMDPDLGFLPFSYDLPPVVFHPVTWIDHGVLKELAYDRAYGVRQLNVDHGLPNSGAFRMSGGDTTIDEMIATTRRGLLVTRFSDVQLLNVNSMLVTGYTRDGLWLIESGKISKAVKNLRFTESPLVAFNNLERLGPVQRVYHPDSPVVVPSVKIADFSFTGLSHAA